MTLFSQVRARFSGVSDVTISCRNDGGPTGCVNTLPDLDQQHLSERNRLP